MNTNEKTPGKQTEFNNQYGDRNRQENETKNQNLHSKNERSEAKPHGGLPKKGSADNASERQK